MLDTMAQSCGADEILTLYVQRQESEPSGRPDALVTFPVAPVITIQSNSRKDGFILSHSYRMWRSGSDRALGPAGLTGSPGSRESDTFRGSLHFPSPGPQPGDPCGSHP